MCQIFFFSLMLSRQDDTSTPHLHKMNKLVGYKDPINPSMKKFHNIYSLLYIYF
jgi:hypothetical protein